jgi:probable HAF family extracellular repeat protein
MLTTLWNHIINDNVMNNFVWLPSISKTLLVFLVAFVCVIKTPTARAAPPSFSTTKLGGLPGGNYTKAFGINNLGDVVGQCSNGTGPGMGAVACYWKYNESTDNYTVIELPDLPDGNDIGGEARSINDFRQIVGFGHGSPSSASVRRAVTWNGNLGSPQPVALDALPGNSDYGEARDINLAGRIAGVSAGILESHPNYWATAWINDAPVMLKSYYNGVAGGPKSYSEAVNTFGDMVGFVDGPGGVVQAAYWHWDSFSTERTDLPLFPRNGQEGLGEANDINDYTQIVGYSRLESGYNHAALWYGDTVYDLGDLNATSDSASYANAINDNRLIVGRDGENNSSLGVLWYNGQTYKLADLIDPADPLYGEFIGEAYDVNDNGWIIARTAGSGDQALLLRPTAPIPPTGPDGDLAPLGMPNGIVDAADVMIAMRIVLGDLVPGTLEMAHGDMDENGIINLSDLLTILGLVIP